MATDLSSPRPRRRFPLWATVVLIVAGVALVVVVLTRPRQPKVIARIPLGDNASEADALPTTAGFIVSDASGSFSLRSWHDGSICWRTPPVDYPTYIRFTDADVPLAAASSNGRFVAEIVPEGKTVHVRRWDNGCALGRDIRLPGNGLYCMRLLDSGDLYCWTFREGHLVLTLIRRNGMGSHATVPTPSAHTKLADLSPDARAFGIYLDGTVHYFDLISDPHILTLTKHGIISSSYAGRKSSASPWGQFMMLNGGYVAVYGDGLLHLSGRRPSSTPPVGKAFLLGTDLQRSTIACYQPLLSSTHVFSPFSTQAWLIRNKYGLYPPMIAPRSVHCVAMNGQCIVVQEHAHGPTSIGRGTDWLQWIVEKISRWRGDWCVNVYEPPGHKCVSLQSRMRNRGDYGLYGYVTLDGIPYDRLTFTLAPTGRRMVLGGRKAGLGRECLLLGW